MKIELSEDQIKEVFVELIARKVSKKANDVSYFGVYRFINRKFDTLLNDAIYSACQMYFSSKDYEMDKKYGDQTGCRNYADTLEEEIKD